MLLRKHNVLGFIPYTWSPGANFLVFKGACALEQNLPSTTSKPMNYFFCSFFNFVIVAPSGGPYWKKI
jgi:hypothetical protein